MPLEPTEQPIKINSTEEPKRDIQVDVAKAAQIARDFVRDNVGNLTSHEFKLERINENSSKEKYVVICSVVPDVGKEKDFYVLHINIDTDKIVPPVGRGKLKDGKLEITEIQIDKKWTD